MIEEKNTKNNNRVTLKDISKKAGFSINTISRALKNKKDISNKTKLLICETARNMGYIPNTVASSLRLGKTKTIAVIMPDILDPFIAILVKDIEYKLRDYGYNIIIINTDEEYDIEKEAIILALKANVAGIIICPTQKSYEDINFLKSKMIPFVLLARRFEDETLDYVVVNEIKGGYLATKHLIERGHKEILFINGPSYISSVKERLIGYKEALKSENIKYKEKLVKEIKITSGNATQLLKKITRDVKYSAIFAFDDLIAFEVISFFQKNKIRVPQDVAVIGYDNIQSRFFSPYPLSTIDYSKRNMAYKAVDILINKINGFHGAEPIHVFQETRLIVRGST